MLWINNNKLTELKGLDGNERSHSVDCMCQHDMTARVAMACMAKQRAMTWRARPSSLDWQRCSMCGCACSCSCACACACGRCGRADVRGPAAWIARRSPMSVHTPAHMSGHTTTAHIFKAGSGVSTRHNYIGHNCMGHEYMGHNFKKDSVSLCARQPDPHA